MVEGLDENKLNLIWVIIEHAVMNQPIQDQQKAIWKWWFLNRRHKRYSSQSSLCGLLNNIRKRSLPTGCPSWQHTVSFGLRPLLPSSRPASSKREVKYQVIYMMILTGRTNVEQRAFWRWLIVSRLSKVAQRKGVSYREPVESSISKLSLSESINHTISNLQTSQDDLYPYISTEASERMQHLSNLSNSSVITDRCNMHYGFDSASDLFNQDLMHLMIPSVKSSRLNLSLDTPSIYSQINTRPNTTRVRVKTPDQTAYLGEVPRYLDYKSCSNSEQEDSMLEYELPHHVEESNTSDNKTGRINLYTPGSKELNSSILKQGKTVRQTSFVRDLPKKKQFSDTKDMSAEEDFTVFPLRYVLKPVKKPSLDVSVFTKSIDTSRTKNVYDRLYHKLSLYDTLDHTRCNISRVDSLCIADTTFFSFIRYHRALKPMVDIQTFSHETTDIDSNSRSYKNVSVSLYDMVSGQAMSKPIQDLSAGSTTLQSRPSESEQTLHILHTHKFPMSLTEQSVHSALIKPIQVLSLEEHPKAYLKSISISTSSTSQYSSPRVLSSENKLISTFSKPSVDLKAVSFLDMYNNIRKQLEMLSILQDKSYINNLASYLDSLIPSHSPTVNPQLSKSESLHLNTRSKYYTQLLKPKLDIYTLISRELTSQNQQTHSWHTTESISKPTPDLYLHKPTPITRSSITHSRTFRYKDNISSTDAQDIQYLETIHSLSKPHSLQLSMYSSGGFQILIDSLKPIIKPRCSLHRLEKCSVYSYSSEVQQLSSEFKPTIEIKAEGIRCGVKISNTSSVECMARHLTILSKPILDISNSAKDAIITSQITQKLHEYRHKVAQNYQSITQPDFINIKRDVIDLEVFPKPIPDLSISTKLPESLPKLTSITHSRRVQLRSSKPIPPGDSMISSKSQNSLNIQRVHDFSVSLDNEGSLDDLAASDDSSIVSCRSSPVLSPLPSPRDIEPVMHVYQGILNWTKSYSARVSRQVAYSIQDISMISKPIIDISLTESNTKSSRIKQLFRSKIHSIDSILKFHVPTSKPKVELFDAIKVQDIKNRMSAELSRPKSVNISTQNLQLSPIHKPKVSCSYNSKSISELDLQVYPAKECEISLHSESIFTHSMKKPIIDISSTTPLNLMEIVKSVYNKLITSRRELYTSSVQSTTHICSASSLIKPTQDLKSLKTTQINTNTQSSVSLALLHSFSKPLCEMVRLPHDASFLHENMSDSSGVSLNASISYILSASVTPNSIESLHSVIKPKLDSFIHMPPRKSESPSFNMSIKDINSCRVVIQKLTALVKPALDLQVNTESITQEVKVIRSTVKSLKTGSKHDIHDIERKKELKLARVLDVTVDLIEEDKSDMHREDQDKTARYTQEKLSDVSYLNLNTLQKPNQELWKRPHESLSTFPKKETYTRFDSISTFPTIRAASYDEIPTEKPRVFPEFLKESQANLNLQSFSAIQKPCNTLLLDSPIKELQGFYPYSSSISSKPLFTHYPPQTTHKSSDINPSSFLTPYFYTTPRFSSGSNSSVFNLSEELHPQYTQSKVLDISVETYHDHLSTVHKPVIDLHTHKTHTQDVWTITKTKIFIKHTRSNKIFHLERVPKFSIHCDEKHLEAMHKPKLDIFQYHSSYDKSASMSGAHRYTALIKPLISLRLQKALKLETQPRIEPPILRGESLRDKDYSIKISPTQYIHTPVYSKEEKAQTLTPIKLIPLEELSTKVVMIQKFIRSFLAKRMRYRLEHDISMHSFRSRSSTSSIDLSYRPKSTSPVLSNIDLLRVASKSISRRHNPHHRKHRRNYHDSSYISKPRYYPIQRASKALIGIILMRIQDSFDRLKFNELEMSHRETILHSFHNNSSRQTLSSQATAFLEDSIHNSNLTRANLAEIHKMDYHRGEFLTSPSSISIQDDSEWFLSRPLTPFEYVYSTPYNDVEKKVRLIQKNVRQFLERKRCCRKSLESDNSDINAVSNIDLFKRISHKLQERNSKLFYARFHSEETGLNRIQLGSDKCAQILKTRLRTALECIRRVCPKVKHSGLMPPLSKTHRKLRKPRIRTRKLMSTNETLMLSQSSISKDLFSNDSSRVHYAECMNEIFTHSTDADYLSKVIKIQRAFRKYLAQKYTKSVYVRQNSGALSIENFEIPQIPIDVLLMKVLLIQKAVRRFLAIKNREKIHKKLKQSFMSSGSSTPTNRRRNASVIRSPKTASKLEMLRQLSISKRDQLLGHQRVKSEIVGLGRKRFYSLQKAVKCMNSVVLTNCRWSFEKMREVLEKRDD